MLPSPRTAPYPGPPRTAPPPLPSLPPSPPSLGIAGSAPPPATAKLDLANLGFDQTPKFGWFHSSAAFPPPLDHPPTNFFFTNNRTLSTRKERRTQITQSNHKTHKTTEFQACNLTCQWVAQNLGGQRNRPSAHYEISVPAEMQRTLAQRCKANRGSPKSSSLFCPETCLTRDLHPLPPPFFNLQVGLVALERFSGRPGIDLNRIGLSGIWPE